MLALFRAYAPNRAARSRDRRHLHRLRLRPPAPRGARADAALRRHDGAVGAARHAVLAAAHAARGSGAVRITELAALALLDRTALSRNLEPLVAQGLVRIAAGTRCAHARGRADARREGRATSARCPTGASAQARGRARAGRSRASTRSSGCSHRSRRCIPPRTARKHRRSDERRRTADWRTPTVVLVAARLILSLAMGIRHGFGFSCSRSRPSMGWGRETFALALAVQNLVWGATQPFAGMVADRFGSARVVLVGCAPLCARPRHDVRSPPRPGSSC